MRYVDWEFYESKNNNTFKRIIAKCKAHGLYELMSFKYMIGMLRSPISFTLRIILRQAQIPFIGLPRVSTMLLTT